ncbi:MAG: hypothetical protein QM820_19555 [Minicystis sp.]
MCWLNSSDLHFPWTLRTVGTVFAEHPEVEWISSLQPAAMDPTGMCAIIGPEPGFARDAFLDGRFLGHPTTIPTVGQRAWIQQEGTFWRRRAWDRIGGTIGEYKLAADFDLWARLYEKADLVGVAAPLALFRFHPEQRSSRIQRYTEESAASLTRLRHALDWQRPAARAAALAARLPRIPGVARAAEQLVGYRGRRLVRRVDTDGNGRWVMEEHGFL